MLITAHAGHACTDEGVVLDQATRSIDVRPVLGVRLAEVGAPDPDLDGLAAGPDTFSRENCDGPGELNFGYRNTAVWLRLPVTLPPGAPVDWLLEVAYPTLDHVTVFWQDAGGNWRSAESGDLVPQSRRPYHHHNLVFPLTLREGSESVILLKVVSAGNLTIPIKLWQPAALLKSDRETYSWHALYFGALLAMLAYNLLLFFSVRDPLYLLYCAMVLGMGGGQLSLHGFGSLLIWPEAVSFGNAAFPVSLAACGLAGALFTRRFLNAPLAARKLDDLVIVLAGLFALEATLGYWMPYDLLAIMVSASGLLFSILAVILGVICLARGQRTARFFLLGWVVLLVGVAITALRNFGFAPTNWLSSNIMQIGSALEMLLLSFALADRIATLQREKDIAHAEAVESDRKLVDTLQNWGYNLEREIMSRTRELREANRQLAASQAFEKKAREEQSHFLAMISHEIRTPVSIVRAATASLRDLDPAAPPDRDKRYDRINRALQRMNALLDVALVQDRTNVGDWAMELTSVDFSTLTREILGMLAGADEARVVIDTGDAALPALRVDHRMIRLALLNLVENAVKYGGHRDNPIHIQISSAPHRDRPGLEWRIRDQGQGIADGLEERIFEKYYRASETSGKPGLGLGLFLARFIFERHKGWLRTDRPENGRGACFIAWLPLPDTIAS